MLLRTKWELNKPRRGRARAAGNDEPEGKWYKMRQWRPDVAGPRGHAKDGLFYLTQ